MITKAFVDLRALNEEAAALVREGFYSVDQSWKERAELKPVENFHYIDGTPQPITHAKMVAFAPEEIADGSYRDALRRFGRGAALAFCKLFDETVGDGRGIVSFLHGEECPSVEGVLQEDGKYVVRGYCDVGIQKA